MLAQINAPHFVAGLVFENDVVVQAAPIIKYMVGWEREKVRSYIGAKGWTGKVFLHASDDPGISEVHAVVPVPTKT